MLTHTQISHRIKNSPLTRKDMETLLVAAIIVLGAIQFRMMYKAAREESREQDKTDYLN